MKKSFSRYWLIYLCFAFVCLVLSTVFLIYTNQVVREYDAAQPERVVARVLDDFSSSLSGNTLPDALNLSALGASRFEANTASDVRSHYLKKIADGGELSYRVKTGAGSDLSKVYSLYAGETPFATLTLKGSNSRNKLFFFSMADWEVESLEPNLSAVLYAFRVCLPEGIHAYFNDVEVGEDERVKGEEGIPVYAVGNLTAKPTIRMERADGTPVDYQIERNVITPILYQYVFSLPDTVQVTLNGKALAGTSDGAGQLAYKIRSMEEPEVMLSDSYGHALSYRGEANLPLYLYEITLPESYRLSVGDTEIDHATATRAQHPDAAQLALYAADVKLPDLLTWQIPMLHEAAEVSVTDQMGNTKVYTLRDHSLKILNQAGASEIPESVTSQIDVMNTAICWSKFMTNDLPGNQRGFSAISPYLIRDSYYYRYAYAWATGVDITFTSVHTITDFTGKRISDFVAYSDTCFSCDIYFEKNMRLYDSQGKGLFVGNRTDIFNSTVYFVYYDDTPDNGISDPHWAIAVMRDVLTKEGSAA